MKTPRGVQLDLQAPCRLGLVESVTEMTNSNLLVVDSLIIVGWYRTVKLDMDPLLM
jgi:hypothetical protein